MKRRRVLTVRPGPAALLLGLLIGATVSGGLAQPSQSEPDPEPASSTLQALLAESRYDEAAALARASIAEARTRFGEDSVEEADLLDALVQALYRGGHAMDAEALEAIQRAIEIKEAHLGRRSRGVATSLMQLGNLYIFRGDDDGALRNYEESVAILENLRATSEDPVERDLAVIFSNIGIVYKRRGDYDAALEVAERALRIRRESLGTEHPDLATSYNNIANILVVLGRYAEARDNNERALRIREKALGLDHELVAESLNNLSSVLGYMGEFDGALAAQERAVDIFTRVLGSDNERTWTVQFNLAVLESDMGDHAGAQRRYQEILVKQRARFGDRNIDLLATLDALAEAALALGDPARARDLFEESLSIYEEQYGEGTDAADYTRLGLGKALTELGEYQRGREVLERSLAIREGLNDPTSPILCDALHALAELHLANGSFDEAAEFAARSARIAKQRLGEWHPLNAEALSILARANAGRGDVGVGFEHALRADHVSRRHLRETMGVLSERLALDYAAGRINGLDLALSLLDQDDTGDATAKAWDALVRSRALIFDEMAQRKRAIHRTADPELASLLADSRRAREQIANLSLRGPGWEDPAAYKTMLDRARAEAERLDRAIALATDDMRSTAPDAEIGLSEVVSRLAPDQALVAFVRHDRVVRDGLGGYEASRVDFDDMGVYRAFVVTGNGNPPRSIALGDAGAIDQLVTDWREKVQVPRGKGTRGFSRVARDENAQFSEYAKAARGLRARIWDPVVDALGPGSQSVFVVPDGSLHVVNLGALVSDDGRFLVEDHRRLWMLSAERSLARSEPMAGAPQDVPGALLAVGGPDYAAELPGIHPSTDSGPPTTARPTHCLASNPFAPLPGTRREANEVAALWASLRADASTVTLLQGRQASELAVKSALGGLTSGASVLHIATHGFFVTDECDENDLRRSNPLVLSGLTLAGADHWRNSPSGENDGLLTAEEFVALDLGAVNLAVLSACDTGLGAIRSRSEGVFGLRRALQIAGARTVVMSLWPVGDEVAHRYMNTFYRNRFEDGRSMQEALRSTSLTLLKDARARGLPAHPRDWAAFVAVGDWR